MATTQTFTVVLPTGLTNGVGKLLTATTSGTAETIHTCHATAYDKIGIIVTNNGATAVNLTIMVGSLEYPTSIPGDGNRYRIMAGERFTGGTIIKAYAGSASKIIVDCVVERIT